MLKPDRVSANEAVDNGPDQQRLENVVRLRGVSKKYSTRSSGDVTALQGVSVDIKANQFVTIVGPSGCGKSTVMKIAGGIIEPSSGTIEFDGHPLMRPSPEIGMVFQKATLMAWRTVLENVLFPIEMLGLSVAQYDGKARALLDMVGLRGFEDVYPQELSGGMQQRAAICRALVYDPKLLLMDEPFGALDALTREEMVIELLRIWDERKKTVLFVTHSISEAVFLADRVLVMTPRPGRVVLDLSIDLPRPRSPDLEFTQEFKHLCDRVRDQIYAGKQARKV
jgi:NitT/TauT family transport system ATP-binding protein